MLSMPTPDHIGHRMPIHMPTVYNSCTLLLKKRGRAPRRQDALMGAVCFLPLVSLFLFGVCKVFPEAKPPAAPGGGPPSIQCPFTIQCPKPDRAACSVAPPPRTGAVEGWMSGERSRRNSPICTVTRINYLPMSKYRERRPRPRKTVLRPPNAMSARICSCRERRRTRMPESPTSNFSRARHT